MIQLWVNPYLDKLYGHNYKSFYLAFLRVAISLWLLKEVFINWSSMDILYGQSSFLILKNNFISRLSGGNIGLIKSHYIWFIALHVLIILLNILGVGRWITALLVFCTVHVQHNMINMALFNGGDMMARQILLCLVFADSYQYFVLFKNKKADDDKMKFRNLLSNLAAFSIMLHLCLAYFATGVAKLGNSFWWHGEAIYYSLSMERFLGTPFNKYIIQYKWINIFINYAVLLFELLFPILIWIKKLRKPLLVMGILFHLSIYIFLMIYGFQVVFILTYGLFVPNKKLLHYAQRFLPEKLIRSN